MSTETFHAMNRAAMNLARLIADSRNDPEGAKANVEFITMTRFQYDSIPNAQYVTDNRYNPLIIGDSYMVIICPNRHRYYVNVTADSVLTACAETLSFAALKL